MTKTHNGSPVMGLGRDIGLGNTVNRPADLGALLGGYESLRRLSYSPMSVCIRETLFSKKTIQLGPIHGARIISPVAGRSARAIFRFHCCVKNVGEMSTAGFHSVVEDGSGAGGGGGGV